MIAKLPIGWFWSYVLPPMTEHDGKKRGWCACAIRHICFGVTRRIGDNECEFFNEVYKKDFKTEREATQAVVDYIKSHKRFKRRWIYFHGEE